MEVNANCAILVITFTQSIISVSYVHLFNKVANYVTKPQVFFIVLKVNLAIILKQSALLNQLLYVMPFIVIYAMNLTSQNASLVILLTFWNLQTNLVLGVSLPLKLA